MESALGEIITFYSYKGGTGRSMALANVACLLAQKQEAGNDVLMIDWDLEAPGLHQFFHGRFDTSRDEHGDMSSGQLGLIDLFYEIRDRLEKGNFQDNIPEDVFAEIDIRKYIVKTNQSSLLLMPAGKFDDGLYSTRVNEFDWSDFFDSFPLVITQFAQYLRQNFRRVLIDSRTGYTDTSGICTSIMPEKLVTVFTPNRQSLFGVIEVIRKAVEYRKQSNDLRPLTIFPLPSRIENAESELLKEWRFGNPQQKIDGYQIQFESVFKEVYRLQECNLTKYFDEYQLQYVPRYSYGEDISVLYDRPEDRLSLARSFESFAEKIISSEVPWEDIEVSSYRNGPEYEEIVGGYIIQENLGEGEYSSTFKGVNQVTKEIVIIKLFNKSLNESKRLFEVETNAYGILKELPGILQIKDRGEDDKFYFIVTEFVLEGSLRNILRKYPEGMNVKDVIQLFTPIADAIDNIHGRNIIHRNLKPENILCRNVSTGYETFITDFGVIKFTTASNQFQTRTTARMSGYIAPEALYADSQLPQTKAVDIYALGIMLYEALEGQVPFWDIKDVLGKKPPREPIRTLQRTNVIVADYLLRAISHDPEKRPATAREIIDGIQDACEGNLDVEQKWIGREIGRYLVEEVLGIGGMGISLLARNNKNDTQVILKSFASLSSKSIKAYEKEMAVFKRLKSKHGVLLPLETFEYEGDYFIVTEYKNGRDLRGWLKTKPKVTETLDVFARIAESIDYIHENRIIHRDIKPENIVYEVLDEGIMPYLTDFGISITLSDTTSSFKTEHGFGTIEYMAPEFFSMNAKKTKAVDIYAFGLMLYEALEGYHPFADSTPQETIAQIISGVIPVPENTIKRLGENAGFLLTKALSKNPEDRPKTATEIILQIESRYIKYIGDTYGNYVIEEYIGRGPYGATYKAYDLNNRSKKVALKLLSIPQAVLPEIGEQKMLERNKGVLPIIDIGYENGVPYLVSEYLDGHNLRQILSIEGMAIQDALEILKPVSETLDYLHEKAIIHGDLKPENILLRKNRTDGSLQPFVNDYGISKIAGAIDALYANSNILLENLNYLAPEILEGRKPSPAADVYSLGIIIYEAMEGKTPFDAKSLPALVKQKLDDDVPVPKNLLKNGGIRAARVLLKALNVKPEKRQNSASDLVSQLEEAIKNRAFTDRGIFIESWIKSRKFLSEFKKNSYAPWASGLLLLLILWAILMFSFLPARQTSSPVTTPTDTPAVAIPLTITATSTVATTSTPTPLSVIPAPTIVLSDQCKLPSDSLDHDYLVPGHLLLEEVYRKQFSSEPDSNDLYAIAYYNNRKILEGYSMYSVIDPISLDIRRGWKIFIPPPDWIDKYKKFPITIPFPLPAQVDSQPKLDISGSSILSYLSAQISKCSTETTKIGLAQTSSGNTISGLRDLCQGKVDLFGASKEVDAAMMSEYHCGGIELEKFEVARYAMVIFINKNNPNADDVQSNPFTNEELAKFLTISHLWKDVRGYWSNNESIARYYPSLESGEFEVVKNGIFPDKVISQDDIPGLNIYDDKQSLLDKVAEDANAVGIVDYNTYQSYQGKDRLITIPVNNIYVSSVIASDNGSAYPLMATLYLYAEKNVYESNDVLRNFINYYLSHELDFLNDLGYLYPSKKGYKGNRDTIP